MPGRNKKLRSLVGILKRTMVVREKDAMLGQIEKKSKKSKKNQTNKLEDTSGNDESNGRRDGTADGKSYVKVDGSLQKEKGEKQHKRKRKSEFSEVETDFMDVAPTEVKVITNLSKGDKKKRNKEKHKLDRDIKVNGVPNEARHNNLEVDGGNNSVSASMGIVAGEKGRSEVKGKKSSNTKITTMKYEDGVKKDDGHRGAIRNKKTSEGKGVGQSQENSEEGNFEVVEKKKRKGKTRKDHSDLDAILQENLTEESGQESSILRNKDFVDSECNDDDKKGCKSKKKQKIKSVEDSVEKPKPKGKSKRVSFSGHVEVFPLSDKNSKEKSQKDGLVRGKRFSPEEDEIVKKAVFNYIKEHDLGEEGLDMVLHCRSQPRIKNCWKEIGTAIPYRPYSAVYYRAHSLFERSMNGVWTEEEYELVRKNYKEHGNNWKMLADGIGRNRVHLKDTWRRIKFEHLKKGKWSREEYQTLYDLVNMDLRMKVASREKKSKHGMLRDNIPWCAISDKLGTRIDSVCCMKWYKQLTSSMVLEGKWADSDDYRLVGALYDLDASCTEDVDWDNLLEHRSGDVCRKRWDQMVRHIGHHGSSTFAEQVEILARRYSPSLAETREVWDSLPVVP